MYIKILIAGIGLFASYRMLSFLNSVAPISKSTKNNLSIVFILVELASWLGFGLWAMRKMYEAEAYVTLIGLGVLLLVFIIPGWFIIGDFLVGILLRIQRKVELNVRFEVDNISGEIVKLGYFNFDIKSKSGSIDTIPYSKIRSKVISRSGDNTNLERELLHFTISSKEKPNEVTERLKVALLLSPWVASSQLPIVKTITSGNQGYEIDVYIYVLKKAYTERIQENINMYFQEKR